MSARPANAADERSSLAVRAASIVILFLGFYGLALALAAVFLAVPWAEHEFLGHVSWAGIACALVGLWFLFAMLPGWAPNHKDRPDPLPDASHPRLRQMIAEVAARAGQAPPDVVYLLPDANAFAAREGGFLGFGGKRVVGIGLPLLSTLSEDEVRAVLAHEFGHYRAGDLRLGPFVHRTRMAVGRAIARLDGSSFLLHWPFLLYAQVFLRVSRIISREQELAADALAASLAGAETTGSALSRVESLAPRWDAYFFGEVLPLVAGGKRPPLLPGFALFLSHAPWRADVAKLVRRAERRAPREHDTHPPLEERLAALGLGNRDPRVAEIKRRRRMGERVSEASALGASVSALTLLEAPERAEADALAMMLKRDAPPLTDLSWDRVAEEGWLPLWRRSLSPLRAELAKIPVREFPAVLDEPEALWARLHPSVISLLSPLGTRRSVTGTLGLYLSVVARDAGFTMSVPPGAEVVAEKGALRFEPEVLTRRLGEGLIDEAEFLAEVTRLGIADVAGIQENEPAPITMAAPPAAPPTAPSDASPPSDAPAGGAETPSDPSSSSPSETPLGA